MSCALAACGRSFQLSAYGLSTLASNSRGTVKGLGCGGVGVGGDVVVTPPGNTSPKIPQKTPTPSHVVTLRRWDYTDYRPGRR